MGPISTVTPPGGLTASQVAQRVAPGQVNPVEDQTSRPLKAIIRVNLLPRFNAVLGVLFVAVMDVASPADQAGAIATKANVGTLVLSHLVPGDDELTTEEWEARARPHFAGSLMCGLDELALG